MRFLCSTKHGGGLIVRRWLLGPAIAGVLCTLQIPALGQPTFIRAQPDAQSLRFVSFLKKPPQQRSEQELLAAVEHGAYALAGLSGSPDGDVFMASAWAVLGGQYGMPMFGNSSEAQIFSGTLLAVVNSINVNTWDQIGASDSSPGSPVRSFSEGPSYANAMRNLTEPDTLQFCGAQVNQCAGVLEQWVRKVGEASQQGAQRVQVERIAKRQQAQDALAARQLAEQRALEKAKNDAVEADIAAQTARIRAKQNAAAPARAQ